MPPYKSGIVIVRGSCRLAINSPFSNNLKVIGLLELEMIPDQEVKLNLPVPYYLTV